ncbi:HAD family hydrolase [Campylobacter estrildidarum]|uniref:HAD family hydrolase n=1 Tax=Campylobacter estrildidarum TaxID=2510189 RepID=A0A4U7BFZ7_9BACT|nr:HAD family phosphatase [Campylobacter estrildidarum]TKX30603.1 HAD family hydrolase [Campylobacter estrildidarum]
MSKIKAVIFDMDGVLIEAKDWHYEALNKALGLFGMEISRYDHLTTFDGLPTKDKLKMLSLDKGLPLSLHSFINELKQQYTIEIVYNSCKPKFHHEYALSKLKNEGYKMAVCSNSIRNSIKVMMQKSSLESYLEFYISNEDVSKGKPDPEMYNKAIKKLDLSPNECMIVEDNENGIAAARASGANVMIVKEVDEVNYENIKKHIAMFENKEPGC